MRQIAIDARKEAIAELEARQQDMASGVDDDETVHDRIAALWENLNTTIVDGILRADLKSWSDVKASGAKGEAVTVMKSLNESWRYLKKPELGLRTDLPPVVDVGCK